MRRGRRRDQPSATALAASAGSAAFSTHGPSAWRWPPACHTTGRPLPCPGICRRCCRRMRRRIRRPHIPMTRTPCPWHHDPGPADRPTRSATSQASGRRSRCISLFPDCACRNYPATANPAMLVGRSPCPRHPTIGGVGIGATPRRTCDIISQYYQYLILVLTSPPLNPRLGVEPASRSDLLLRHDHVLSGSFLIALARNRACPSALYASASTMAA